MRAGQARTSRAVSTSVDSTLALAEDALTSVGAGLAVAGTSGG